MLSKRTDKNWQAVGQRMPYYGVVSIDEFKPEVFDQTAFNYFFETGETHIELILNWIEHYLVENFQPTRCLDFGCGVGRLVVPLAKRFQDVVGVDVSRAMLDEAKDNCEKQGLDNITLLESDDELSKVNGKFDFIHSFIVFQHIDVQRGEKIFKRLLDSLNEDGVGVLHFTYAREDDRFSERAITWLRGNVPLVHGLINLIRGRDFGYPYIAMNKYDLNRLLFILQQKGCDRTILSYTKHGRDLGVVLMFQKKANDNPPNFL